MVFDGTFQWHCSLITADISFSTPQPDIYGNTALTPRHRGGRKNRKEQAQIVASRVSVTWKMLGTAQHQPPNSWARPNEFESADRAALRPGARARVERRSRRSNLSRKAGRHSIRLEATTSETTGQSTDK
jgi:hypothetical protein